MKRLIFSWFLFAAILGGLLAFAYAGQPELLPPPAEAKQIDIEGWYSCEGTDPDSGPYKALCIITKHGVNYRCVWTIQSGLKCQGLGAVEDGYLSVSGVTGGQLCLFRLKIDEVNGKPVLTGYYASGETRGKETLTLLRRPSL